MSKWKNSLDKSDLPSLYLITAVAFVVLCLLILDCTHLIQDIKTNWIAIAAAVIAFFSMRSAAKSNKKAAVLFISQEKPIIDVTPIAISQNDAGTHATTYFSLINTSGFEARNVGVDLKYQTDWIGEWIKADNDKKDKGLVNGVVQSWPYPLAPKMQVDIPKIKPGVTKNKDKSGGKIGISGAFNIENICNSCCSKRAVWVRVSWENKYGHPFDEIHEYELICTKAKGGRSFTFIPKGIVSQKQSTR